MRKLFLVSFSLLVAAAMIMVGGCSQEHSTSPDTSSAVLGQNATTSPGTKDVLIGWAGNRPDAALNATGASIKREYSHLPIVFASVPENNINRLKSNPNILFVESPVVKGFTAQTLDWGVDRIDAEYVWTQSSYDGSGVNVAILDTGGDMDHPDLTWAGGYSVVSRDPNDFDDKVGHGTHCAGIVSADNNDFGVVGVAPNCDIWAVQISDSKFIVTQDIIDGINWIIGTYYDADPNNNIQVVNMSFGGPESQAEGLALEELYDLGVLLVSSAGNASGPLAYPESYPFVMAITASDIYDNFATYSNFGPEVELIAPGTRIYSTYKRGKYWPMSGTSMACPMVVGAAALAWQANPGYSRDQIRDLLNSTAEDIGLTAYQQGNGLVDCEKAVLGTTNGNNY